MVFVDEYNSNVELEYPITIVTGDAIPERHQIITPAHQ